MAIAKAVEFPLWYNIMSPYYCNFLHQLECWEWVKEAVSIADYCYAHSKFQYVHCNIENLGEMTHLLMIFPSTIPQYYIEKDLRGIILYMYKSNDYR